LGNNCVFFWNSLLICDMFCGNKNRAVSSNQRWGNRPWHPGHCVYAVVSPWVPLFLGLPAAKVRWTFSCVDFGVFISVDSLHIFTWRLRRLKFEFCSYDGATCCWQHSRIKDVSRIIKRKYGLNLDLTFIILLKYTNNNTLLIFSENLKLNK